MALFSTNVSVEKANYDPIPVVVPDLEIADAPPPPKTAVNHYRIHSERPFLIEERATTTVLLGGLSPAHDYLVEATLQSLGLKTKMLPPTNLSAFHVGREYGNNGFCNPSYFLLGNLINYLRDLEKSGLSKEAIIDSYLFFTAGCNAPCRFGMMETEYRMALKDCGFDGFRIITFQNEGGLKQQATGNGLDISPAFFLAIVNALNLADVVNELVYATRPFEVVKGQTGEVQQKALDLLYRKLKDKKTIAVAPGWNRFFRTLRLEDTALFLYRFWDQLTSDYYTEALKEVHALFEAVEVDRFRSKPVVKITGEFWAMTTVGAGNFHLFRFLESEGAVLLIEPVASLIQFMLSKGMLKHNNRKAILLKNGVKHWWNIGRRLHNYRAYQQKYLLLWLGTKLFRREYSRLLKALGGDNHMLIKQPVLQQLAHRFYNINIEGGEGYMEIAKNIYYHEHHRAHMVLSLKPFGCMPSTQSDGVQAAVQELNHEMIFLPIETAGEGETNAQSRVLMALTDAQAKARKEMNDARSHVSETMEAMRAFVDRHPELKSPFYVVPHRKGVVNPAAHFLYHVDDLMRQK